jgi:hypothetical protein
MMRRPSMDDGRPHTGQVALGVDGVMDASSAERAHASHAADWQHGSTTASRSSSPLMLHLRKSRTISINDDNRC